MYLWNVVLIMLHTKFDTALKHWPKNSVNFEKVPSVILREDDRKWREKLWLSWFQTCFLLSENIKNYSWQFFKKLTLIHFSINNIYVKKFLQEKYQFCQNFNKTGNFQKQKNMRISFSFTFRKRTKNLDFS